VHVNGIAGDDSVGTLSGTGAFSCAGSIDRDVVSGAGEHRLSAG